MTAPTLVSYDRYRYLGMGLDQWLELGRAQLDDQRLRVLPLLDHYDGNFPLLHLPGENRDVFRRLLREAITNWCELVVNAVAERLYVVGFDFHDEAINALAWLIWQDNLMDADSEMVQTDALVAGHSFAGAWPDETRTSGVRIDLESAAQLTLMYAPGTRRHPLAAFKAFGGDEDRTEVLVLPDRVQTWTPNNRTAEINLTGLVPYVEVAPAPQLLNPPRSEMHSAISIQNRIHTTIYNRMVATDFGAFRQVTATGVKLTKDPTGRARPPFNVGADRLLVSENEAARFGVIPESNLAGYLRATDDDVRHMAAITQTPPHYLLGQIINASGDALKAAEAGLVSKVRRRAAHIGEAWEELMRLALGFAGNEGAADVTAEVLWRDMETRSEGELVDALVKMAALGIPRRVLWRRWGLSPQETADWPNPDEPVLVPAADQPAAVPLTALPPAGGNA